VLGGLASALFAWLFGPANKHLITRGAKQPLVQLMGLGTALGVAAAAGCAAGWLVGWVSRGCKAPWQRGLVGPPEEEAGGEGEGAELYEDAVFWHEVEKED